MIKSTTYSVGMWNFQLTLNLCIFLTILNFTAKIYQNMHLSVRAYRFPMDNIQQIADAVQKGL